MSTSFPSRQDQYLALRRQLTDSNYTETFSVDSVELITRLFTDVQNYSLSYRQLQEKEGRLLADLSLAQAQLFPLRKENARLARENHELHLDHIRLSEEGRLEVEKYSRKARELSDQLTEMRLLNKVYEEQVREKAEAFESLRETYESLTDPAVKAKHIISANVKASSKIPRSEMITNETRNQELISAWRALTSSNIATIKDTNVEVLTSMRNQVEAANEKVKELEGEISKLRSSLAAREQELSRTSKLIGNAAAKTNSNAADSNMIHFGIDSTAVDASNKRIIDQLNGQVDFLNNEVAFREAQLSTLTSQLSEYEILKSELGVKSAAVDKLKEDNTRLVARVQTLENKLVSMRSGGHTPRGGQSQARSPSPTNMTIIEQQEKIKQLEDLNNRITIEKDQLARELRISQKDADRLSILSSPRSAVSRSPAGINRAGSTNTNATANNALVTELNREVEDLRKKNMQLSKQVKELEARANYLQSKDRPQGQSRGSVLSRTSSVASMANRAGGGGSGGIGDYQLINDLEEEILTLRTTLSEKDRRIVAIQHDEQKYRAMFEEAQRMMDEKQHALQDLQQQLSMNEDDSQTVMSIRNQLQMTQNKLEQINATHEQEVQRFKTELFTKEEEIAQLQTTLQRFEEARQREERLRKVSSTTEQSSATLAAIVTKETEQYQRENGSLRLKVTTLESQVRLLEQRLDESNQRIVEEEMSHATDTAGSSVLRVQVQELRQANSQLTEQFVALQQTNAKLENAMTTQRRQSEDDKHKKRLEDEQTRKLIEEKQALEQRNAELVNMIKRSEGNQQVSNQRIRSLEEAIHQLEDRIHSFETERETLFKGIQEKEQTYQHMKKTMQELDSERDTLQETIDRLEDNLTQKTHEMNALSQQLAQTRVLHKNSEQKVLALAKETQALQKIAADYDGRANSMKIEIDELRRKLSQKMMSEGQSSEDLMLMTKENQALSRDLSAMLAERDSLRHHLQEVTKALQESQSTAYALDVEKKDLLENYRSLAKEKRRMEDDMKALGSRQMEDTSALQQLQQERMDLLSKLQVYNSLEERWAQERAANIQQMELLNDKLVQSQRRIESIESDNRRMIQDSQSMRQNSAMLNERNAVILKRASAAGEANKVLTSRLTSVERERDALRALIEVERQRAVDMAKVAESARIEAATKDIQLQRMRSDLQEAQEQQQQRGGR